MPKFRLHFTCYELHSVDVEATNEDEAREMADDVELNDDTLDELDGADFSYLEKLEG